MRRRARATVVWIALTCSSAACGERDRAAADERGARRMPPRVTAPANPSTVSATGESRGGTADTARNRRLEPGALHTVSAEPASGWKGPGGQPFDVTLRTADPASALARRFGTITLRTALRTRTPNVGQYPCTSCHVGRAVVMADERVGDAHQNIKAVHPEQTGGLCSTCHASDNVELLALKSGERATLDHAYRLCAQCHFSQAESWAGGAHGKRLDGWQGRRVLMGCADCHDPHKPALEPRIPFRAPRLERPRGHDR